MRARLAAPRQPVLLRDPCQRTLPYLAMGDASPAPRKSHLRCPRNLWSDTHCD